MSRKRSTQSEKNTQVVMATIVPDSNSNSIATDPKQVMMATIIPDPNQVVTYQKQVVTYPNQVVMGTPVADPAQYHIVQNSSNLPESIRAFLSAVRQAQEHTIQLVDSIETTQYILTQGEYDALILENTGLNKQLSDMLNLYKQEITISANAHNSLVAANSNCNHKLFMENFNEFSS